MRDVTNRTEPLHPTRRGPASSAWIGLTLLAGLIVVPGTEWLRPHYETAAPLPAIAINVLVFASMEWMIVALTNRPLFAVALTTVLLEMLVFCNRWKLRYLGAPIHPADVSALPNLFHIRLFSTAAVSFGALAGLVGAAGLAILLRVHFLRASSRARIAFVLVSTTIFALLVVAPRSPAAVDFLFSRGIYQYAGSPEAANEANGLMLDLLLHVNDLFVSVPSDYNRASVQRALVEFSTPTSSPPSGEIQTNLILLVVEAMMDPADLGWRFTEDPMPFFDGLREHFSAGWVYSPEAGGRSANPEFELLSGFSLYYLPRDSVPYISLVSRPLPALPRVLSERGYSCRALHVDTLAFFNYLKAYNELGFSGAETLRWRSDVPLDASGRVPSDEALIDAVIEAARRKKPQFLFAFTNGTHLPYDYSAYLGSNLDVLDEMPSAATAEVKTYINALRAADRAIEKLVRSFESTKDPTVIAILGDHLPGLSSEAFQRSKMMGARGFLQGVVFSHRTPAVLWSNLGTPKRDFELSLNFFGQRILNEMRVPLPRLWQANAQMASRYPVLSKFVQRADGNRFLPDELPADDADVIRRYGLLQYDLMFGERYSLQPEIAMGN